VALRFRRIFRETIPGAGLGMASLWFVFSMFVGPGCRFDPVATLPGDRILDASERDGAVQDAGIDGSQDAAIGPAGPLSLSVQGREDVCPDGWVNSATVESAAILVGLGAQSRSSDQVFVSVTDGAGTTIQLGPMPATQGSGTVSFTADLTTMSDGPLALRSWVSRGSLPSQVIEGQATKDTVVDLSVDPLPSPTGMATELLSGMAGPDVVEIVVLNETTGATVLGQVGVGGLFTAQVALDPGDNRLSVSGRDAVFNAAVVRRDWNQVDLLVRRDDAYVFSFVADSEAFPGQQVTPLACSGVLSAVLFHGKDALDVFASGCNLLFHNDGSGGFSVGNLSVALVGDRGAVWGDFDNDGDWDLALDGYVGGNTSLPTMHLYRNTLVETGAADLLEATAVAFAPANPEGLAWMDQDGDGWLDLMLQDGALVRIFRNQGPGVNFSDVTSQLGLDDILIGNGDWLAVADFDRDGDTDAVVGAPIGRLFRAEAGGFSEEHEALGLRFSHGNYRKWGLSWGDYDNDGDFDLWIRDEDAMYGFSYNLLYSWDATRFISVGQELGLTYPAAVDDAAWGDVDNDGWLDLVWLEYSGGGYGVVVALNRGDPDGDGVWEFETRMQTNMFYWTAAPETLLLEDVDRDGDLDLLVGFAGANPVLLRNDVNDVENARRNPRFLEVLVQGAGPSAGGANRSAVGAVVELRQPDSQGNCQNFGPILATRQVDGGRGNGGQASPVLHFGGLLPSALYCLVAYFPGQSAPTIARVRPRDSFGSLFTLLQ